MTQREASGPLEETKQIQAEFPASGTPANPLDGEWLPLSPGEDPLFREAD
ncbi:hypothetical protein ACAF76_006085 [Brevibacillus sp. TJ4]